MGNNCDTVQNPDTSNVCEVSVGGRSTMPGFCTLSGIGGDSYRREFCSRMSVAGEWGNALDLVGDTCNYMDCNNYKANTKSGCCGGTCCAIIGDKLSCQRLSFTGDPVSCCLNNYNCSGGNNSLCFSDPQQQNTCSDGKNGHPNFRNVISSDCQDVLFQYCSGTQATDDYNSTSWMDRWTINNGGQGSCMEAVRYNLFSFLSDNPCFTGLTPTPGICGGPVTVPMNSQGYFWSQQLISEVMKHYSDNGFRLGTLPGLPGYDPFQDFLYNEVCCPYPGLCQQGLVEVCSTTTAQRISLNPTLASWCGCHLPVGEYEDYSVKYNIPAQCSPMCNRVGTIPIVGVNGNSVPCTQNVCLMDDITVNIINSQIGGGIDFGQICGNCGNGQCSCIINNNTIDVENSTIGGNVIPIQDGCGSFTCTQTNPGLTGPNVINVPCGGTGPFNPYEQYQEDVAAAQQEAQKLSWLWTLIVIAVALLLIFVMLWLWMK